VQVWTYYKSELNVRLKITEFQAGTAQIGISPTRTDYITDDMSKANLHRTARLLVGNK